MDYPIIGTGFGTYGDSASLSYQSPIYEKYRITTEIYSDNQYIQIITQTGTLRCYFICSFYSWHGRSPLEKERELSFAIPLIALLVGGFVQVCFIIFGKIKHLHCIFISFLDIPLIKHIGKM